MRRLTALAAALTLAATVAACGGDDGDSGDDGNGTNDPNGTSEPDDSGDEDEPKSGGTFTTIISTTDATAPVNPFAAPTNSWDQFNALKLAYAKVSLDDPNDFYPALAESWEISDDFSEVVVHLQPDAKWSDGTDVTAADVELSYKIAYTRGAGAFVLTPGAAGAVGEVEVVDDKTLRFTQDPANVINTFARGILDLVIVPAHVWGDVLPADFDDKLAAAQGEGDDADAARDEIAAIAEEVVAFAPEEDVSAGPFVFERATPSDVLLAKNEHFYAADNIPADNLVIKNYSGNQQIWDFLNAAEVDNAPFTAVPADVMSGFEANESISVSHGYSPVVAGLAFNQSIEPYDDLNVRKALAYLIDREQAIQVGTPEGGKAPSASTGMHSDAFEAWAGDPESLGLDPYDHDPAAAEAALEDAGFTNDGGTWLKPDGEPWKVTFQVVDGFTDWIAVAENVVTQLNEFGIEAETQTSADFTVYQEEMAAGEYEMGLWLLGIFPAPYDVYQRIYGQTNGWTVLGDSVEYSAPGENGNWMGGSETYEVDGETVNPGELTLSLRTTPVEQMGDTVATLGKITNENLPVLQMWDYVQTQFFVTDRYIGWENVPNDALRLRAGLWMMQGWITAK